MIISRDKLLTYSVLFSLVFCLVAHGIRADESDKNWTLLWAAMMLDGRELYTQALTVLPPMIFWLYSLPVMLSRISGLPDQYMLVVLGCMLIAFVSRLCMRLMQQHPQFSGQHNRQWQFMLLLVMTLVVWFDSQSFLDREHLFFVLFFPYLLRWSPGIAPYTSKTHHRVLVGILSAVGLSIKPHLLVIFFAVQLATIARTRSLAIVMSLENIIIYGSGLLYLAIIVSIYPAYINEVLPIAMLTYAGITDSVQNLVFAGSTYFIFVVSFIHFGWQYRTPYRADIVYFLTVCAAWLVYALLNNGWYYTWAPLGSLLLFLTGWLLWENAYLKQKQSVDAKQQREIAWGQICCMLNMAGNTLMIFAFNLSLLYMGCHDVCKKTRVLSDIVRAEQVKSFEFGYKTLIGEKLMIDANYYFSSYNDFLLNEVVMQPESDVLANDGSINPGAAVDLVNGDSHLFQLYTNATDRVTAQGATLGITYVLPRNYTASANGTWADFNLQDADPNHIPAFNTPKFRTAMIFGNSSVTKNLGFQVAWRWQDAFDWTSTFNQMRPGRIEAYSVVDAQVSYKALPLKAIFKLGANNILNNQVYQAYGSPSIGAVYYFSIVFDQFLN